MDIAVPATPRQHCKTSKSNAPKRKSDGTFKTFDPTSYGRSNSCVEAPLRRKLIRTPLSLQRHRTISIPPQLSIPSSYMAMTTKIADYLLLGTTGDALLNDSEALQSMEIYYIIDCCAERRGSMRSLQRHQLLTAELGFTVIKLNLRDEADAELKPAFDLVLPVVRRAREEGKKCLIHCHSGMSRSVSLALACLIVLEKMTLLDGMRLVKERRQIASPNPGFMAQLIDLEQDVDRETGRGVGIPSVDLSRYTHDRFAKPDTFATHSASIKMDDEPRTPHDKDTNDDETYRPSRERQEHDFGDDTKEDDEANSLEGVDHRRRRRRRVDTALPPKESNAPERSTTVSSIQKGAVVGDSTRSGNDMAAVPSRSEANGCSFCVGSAKDSSFSDLLCGSASQLMNVTTVVKTKSLDASPGKTALTPVTNGTKVDREGNPDKTEDDDEIVVSATDCVSSTYVAPITMEPSDDCKWSGSNDCDPGEDDEVVQPLQVLQLSAIRRKSLIRLVSESEDGEEE